MDYYEDEDFGVQYWQELGQQEEQQEQEQNHD